MKPQERNQLIDALIEGESTEADFLRLEAELSLDPAARSEYYRRLALTASLEAEAGAQPRPANRTVPLHPPARNWVPRFAAMVAAAAFALVVGWWGIRVWHPALKKGTTSRAVAMLNRTVDAQWSAQGEMMRSSAPLEPGWLRLESGSAQVVFYSGARVVIEGPAEIQLISQNEAVCRLGRMVADVPPQARGFRVRTPNTTVTDLGTSFGLEVKDRSTELHVFKGTVELQPAAGTGKQTLREGAGALVETLGPLRLLVSNPGAFVSLFEMQARSVAAQSLRYDRWRDTSGRLNRDPSLILHLEFENEPPSHWQLNNSGHRKEAVSDATLVGCQWTEGRWPEKRALEFQNVNDRVRVTIPGEFQSLTLAAWVRVQGLDRQFNSLFMCDGLDPGTVHWLIRHDGVLGLTLKGPGRGNFQIVTSPPVLTLNRLGLWTHLAVVVDGNAKRAVHYVNGIPVSEKKLTLGPPYHLGAAELGNWNAKDFAGDDPSLIRNFSGAMDEFCLFGRVLSEAEIRTLYLDGKPQAEP